MDGFARPAGPAPVRPQPVPMPAQRPVGPAPRPMAPAPARPTPPAAVPSAPRREKLAPVAQPSVRKSGGWKVALQFVVGLLVIAAVAATIVWLYVKYYAQ
jgi:hypothetical protein